jgi:hypothetical protein
VTSAGAAVTGTLSASTTGQVGTTLGVGGATPAASGAGITFPATQSASTDANTLDDYEEGTWTPTITSGSGTFTTVSFSGGVYTKIGNIVTCSGTIVITNAGTAASGINVTFPITAASANYSGSASEWTQTGWACSLYVATTSAFTVLKYDGSTVIATGRTIGVSITYRAA